MEDAEMLIVLLSVILPFIVGGAIAWPILGKILKYPIANEYCQPDST